MDIKRSKFVRFSRWSSDKSYSTEWQYNVEDGSSARKTRQTVNSVWDIIRRSCGKDGFERLGGKKKPLSSLSQSTQPASESSTRKGILDPHSPFLQKWNKIFVIACVIAVSLDPLFFYIPVVDVKENCLDLDKTIQTTACALRTLIDVFYIIRILFQFRTGFIAPSSRVFGRGELVDDLFLIARRYLTSYFIIDILAILPLPQVVLLIVLPKVSGPGPLAAKKLLKFVIFSQYVPRLIRIYPLFIEVTTSSGILTETAWAGAAFNLFLYMLASHVIGAFWYLFSIEQEDTCWHNVCQERKCNSTYLYCGDHRRENYRFLTDACPFTQPDDIKNSSVFDFGMFIDAFESEVVKSKDFPKKFFYCFWWGFRNLSSMGQNLKTSTFTWEILFAVFISVSGLVLFSLLIGNMQKYLQSTTARIEEMRLKRRDAEHWMSHRMLPENLKEQIRGYEQYKWQQTRGVEERTLIRNLPKDLKRQINRHLCLGLLKRVHWFQNLDEQILDAVFDRLRPALHTKDSYIFREGDPVDEMLFIMRGNLVSVTTNGGRTGFLNAVYIQAGDYCGELLLEWALDPQSSSNLPISSRTVRATTEVEAFALVAEDLKSVASQFQRLQHQDIQHTFRYWSAQWKTRAACVIQGAWRRFCKRKQERILRRAEKRRQVDLANEAGTSPSLGAAM